MEKDEWVEISDEEWAELSADDKVTVTDVSKKQEIVVAGKKANEGFFPWNYYAAIEEMSFLKKINLAGWTIVTAVLLFLLRRFLGVFVLIFGCFSLCFSLIYVRVRRDRRVGVLFCLSAICMIFFGLMFLPARETEQQEITEVQETTTETLTESSKENPTEASTEPPTEPQTESPTELSIEPSTESPTELPSDSPTKTLTKSPTEAPAETPTEAPTETPTEAPTEQPTEAKIRGYSASMEVYVSNNGKIHIKHNCSGMKSYTVMSLEEAYNRGYDFCQRCW